MSAARDRGAKSERSVVVSPLLNLARARPTGATLNHSRPLVPLGTSRIAGEAMLSLMPDHRTIDVRVRLDRPLSIDIGLRRLDRHGPWHDDGEAGDLLIVEIAASRSAVGALCRTRRFSLDDRRAFAPLADADDLLDSCVQASELRAGSVAGVALEPAIADRAWEQGPAAYSTERMLAEIAAAELSVTAIAASRHVELAILHARRLSGAR